MDNFYEKLATFETKQNIRWNDWISENKEYIPYEQFLFLYCDEDFDIDDPRYENKVIVADENKDICDYL